MGKFFFFFYISLSAFLMAVPSFATNEELAVVYFKNKSDKQWDWLSRAISYTLNDNLRFIKNLPLANQSDIIRIINTFSESDYFDSEANYLKLGARIKANYLIFGNFELNGDKLKIILRFANVREGK